MNRSFYYRALVLIGLLFQTGLKSQLNIISIPVQPFNMTPDALLNVNIMNNGEEAQVQIVSQVINSGGVSLLTVKSGIFKLPKGLNPGTGGDRKVQSAEYSSAPQTNYLRTTHNLPSGRYKVCSTVFIMNGSNETDAVCEELEADLSQYLYLVNPFDGDTIDTRYPLLSWAHSEPFSILSQGESYRMIVTELKPEQTAEEAVTVNSPAMIKNYLNVHQLQYPFDAKELKDGGRYAWQVQKMGDGVVINKTEAWIFNVRKLNGPASQKYVVPKRELDGSYYHAYDGAVYFKFNEEYKTQGQLSFTLRDSKSKTVALTILKDQQNNSTEDAPSQLKKTGTNLYELNMNSKKAGSGFYTLEIKNEKNESFYLKIFLP